MEAFSKNLAGLGSKVKDQATEFAEKHELEKMAVEAKAKGDEFVKEHSLDEKAQAAKTKVECFAKEHKLDVKATEATAKVEAFVKEHDLEAKAATLVKSAENALGFNTNEVAVYPVVIQALGFKLVDKNDTSTKAESEEAAVGIGGKSGGDSEGTDDVAAKRKSFAAKYAPRLSNIQEGSIADTLMKAKSKVFGVAAVGTGVATGAALAASGKEKGNDDVVKKEDTKDDTLEKSDEAFDKVMKEANEPYSGPGDVSIEVLKEDAKRISAEMQEHAEKITDREDVQKVLVPLMAKLACAKNKFLSMSSKNKNKIEEEEGEGTAATEKKEDDATPAEEKEEQDRKLPSEFAANDLKFRAEKAAKQAFENAERIAKKVAIKVGIIKVADDTKEEGIEVTLEGETDNVLAITDDKENKTE